MHSQTDIENVASNLLKSQGFQLVKCKILQTLWAGYGHICSLEVSPIGQSPEKTIPFILKYVSPPTKSSQSQNEGHLRKVISYQVEQQFYAHLAPKMPKDVAVASCLASIDKHDSSGNITAMILNDLRVNFPLAGEKRGELNQRQVNAAIDWLAGFHGFWWANVQDLPRASFRKPPLDEAHWRSSGVAEDPNVGAVWLNGGYTYLATRRSEYAGLSEDETSEWSDRLCRPLEPGSESVAERVAKFLSPCIDRTSAITPYETLIHGDVKSENLFTTSTGDAVAFFDFQYVGLGLGVCDLAKLFTCSLPESMLCEAVDDGVMHPNEEKILRRYVNRLEKVSGEHYEWSTFVRHWETALVDWLRFQASWGFWGNTEWLEARVRTIVEDQDWRMWLDKNLSLSGESVH